MTTDWLIVALLVILIAICTVAVLILNNIDRILSERFDTNTSITIQ